MKKYKMIINFNTKEEKSIYFQNMTIKKFDYMEANENYILFYYDKFLKCYVAFRANLTEKDKKFFSENIQKYRH